jgi:hypothetical protein
MCEFYYASSSLVGQERGPLSGPEWTGTLHVVAADIEHAEVPAGRGPERALEGVLGQVVERERLQRVRCSGVGLVGGWRRNVVLLIVCSAVGFREKCWRG